MTFDIRVVLDSDWSRELDIVFQIDKLPGSKVWELGKPREAFPLKWISPVVGKARVSVPPRCGGSVVNKILGAISETGKPRGVAPPSWVGPRVDRVYEKFSYCRLSWGELCHLAKLALGCTVWGRHQSICCSTKFNENLKSQLCVGSNSAGMRMRVRFCGREYEITYFLWGLRRVFTSFSLLSPQRKVLLCRFMCKLCVVVLLL